MSLRLSQVKHHPGFQNGVLITTVPLTPPLNQILATESTMSK